MPIASKYRLQHIRSFGVAEIWANEVSHICCVRRTPNECGHAEDQLLCLSDLLAQPRNYRTRSVLYPRSTTCTLSVLVAKQVGVLSRCGLHPTVCPCRFSVRIAKQVGFLTRNTGCLARTTTVHTSLVPKESRLVARFADQLTYAIIRSEHRVPYPVCLLGRLKWLVTK